LGFDWYISSESWHTNSYKSHHLQVGGVIIFSKFQNRGLAPPSPPPLKFCYCEFWLIIQILKVDVQTTYIQRTIRGYFYFPEIPKWEEGRRHASPPIFRMCLGEKNLIVQIRTNRVQFSGVIFSRNSEMETARMKELHRATTDEFRLRVPWKYKFKKTHRTYGPSTPITHLCYTYMKDF